MPALNSQNPGSNPGRRVRKPAAAPSATRQTAGCRAPPEACAISSTTARQAAPGHRNMAHRRPWAARRTSTHWMAGHGTGVRGAHPARPEGSELRTIAPDETLPVPLPGQKPQSNKNDCPLPGSERSPARHRAGGRWRQQSLPRAIQAASRQRHGDGERRGLSGASRHTEGIGVQSGELVGTGPCIRMHCRNRPGRSDRTPCRNNAKSAPGSCRS